MQFLATRHIRTSGSMSSTSSHIMKAIASYGEWKSPITAELIAGKTKSLAEVASVGETAFWLLADPTDKGRVRVMSATSGKDAVDSSPVNNNVRTRVHEYGGGSYLPLSRTSGLFSDFATQALIAYYGGVAGDAKQQSIEVAPGNPYRYANFHLDKSRGVVFAIREDHTIDEPSKVVNTLVAILLSRNVLDSLDLQDVPSLLPSDSAVASETVVLAEGADFYSSPRLSPDGAMVSWVQWNHPNLPWDDTELYVATVGSGSQPVELLEPKLVAGGKDECVMDPLWHSNSTLLFVTDRNEGWWNLHSYDVASQKVECVVPQPFELGGPRWVMGPNSFDIFQDGTVVMPTKDKKLLFLDAALKPIGTVTLGDGSFSTSELVAMKGDSDGGSYELVLLTGSPTKPPTVYRCSITKDGLKSSLVELYSAMESDFVDTTYFSIPERITFPTEFKGEANESHGLLYMPSNPDFEAPTGELPPLLVKVHGGPTAQTRSVFRIDIQFWTSRGFAVLDVDYGGSTGYGREYRQRLKSTWGVVDTADCANGANYLAGMDLTLSNGEVLKNTSPAKVDAKRLAIDGGSAGGYTTLSCLTFTDVFSAGCSLYGVADIEMLCNDTHKFESKYTFGLVGEYPAEKELYKERSPINHTDQLSCPILILQGDEDKIVPPNQAEAMFEAVKQKNIPTCMIMFQGEQHGFRKQENKEMALNSELNFYGAVFGFKPDVQVELDIVNREKLTAQA